MSTKKGKHHSEPQALVGQTQDSTRFSDLVDGTPDEINASIEKINRTERLSASSRKQKEARHVTGPGVICWCGKWHDGKPTSETPKGQTHSFVTTKGIKSHCAACGQIFEHQNHQHTTSYQLPDVDGSDLATILAALRLFQRTYEDASAMVNSWPEHFTDDEGDVIPPTEDIDDLCERLNCGEDRQPTPTPQTPHCYLCGSRGEAAQLTPEHTATCNKCGFLLSNFEGRTAGCEHASCGGVFIASEGLICWLCQEGQPHPVAGTPEELQAHLSEPGNEHGAHETLPEQDAASREGITVEPEFLCICGNHPNAQGAYPCDRQGKGVNPTPDEWPDDLYRCDRCERIFNGHTGEVIGQAATNAVCVEPPDVSDFLTAQAAYFDAAQKLSLQWEKIGGGEFVTSYPRYLPSFDEHVMAIAEWVHASIPKKA